MNASKEPSKEPSKEHSKDHSKEQSKESSDKLSKEPSSTSTRTNPSNTTIPIESELSNMKIKSTPSPSSTSKEHNTKENSTRDSFPQETLPPSTLGSPPKESSGVLNMIEYDSKSSDRINRVLDSKKLSPKIENSDKNISKNDKIEDSRNVIEILKSAKKIEIISFDNDYNMIDNDDNDNDDNESVNDGDNDSDNNDKNGTINKDNNDNNDHESLEGVGVNSEIIPKTEKSNFFGDLRIDRKVKSATDTADCSTGYCIKGGTDGLLNEGPSLASIKEGPSTGSKGDLIRSINGGPVESSVGGGPSKGSVKENNKIEDSRNVIEILKSAKKIDIISFDNDYNMIDNDELLEGDPSEGVIDGGPLRESKEGPSNGSKEGPSTGSKDDHTGSIKEGPSMGSKGDPLKGDHVGSVEEGLPKEIPHIDETDDTAYESDFDLE
jgi:hypothetical protein